MPQILLFGLLIISVNFLAGCMGSTVSTDKWDNPRQTLHYERYPIKMAKGKMRMNAPLRRGAVMTATEKEEVERFVTIYKNAGAGQLVIDRPHGRGLDDRGRNLAYKIRHIALSAGISEENISHRRYGAKKNSDPLIISFERIFAVTSRCGDWSKDITRDYENENFSDFGCAFQHNLAAMAANPRDLFRPRALDGETAGRRGVVIDAYRRGETTSRDRGDTTGVASDIGG